MDYYITAAGTCHGDSGKNLLYPYQPTHLHVYFELIFFYSIALLFILYANEQNFRRSSLCETAWEAYSVRQVTL